MKANFKAEDPRTLNIILRRLDGKQITHQFDHIIIKMIYLTINYHLRLPNLNILGKKMLSYLCIDEFQNMKIFWTSDSSTLNSPTIISH